MSPSRSSGRERLVVAVTFPIHPPRGGGQVRIFHLFRELAAVYDIEVVALGVPGADLRRRELAPGLWETRIPKSAKHADAEARLEREIGTLVTDIAFPRLYRLTPDYVETLRRVSIDARAVIASHPYPLPALLEVTDSPVWYEAQDVESQLKADVLPDNAAARDLLTEVESVERAACERAELIWACSDTDRTEFVERYGIPPDRVLVVPNGVSLDELTYVPPAVRADHKRQLGIEERCLSVFIGSWHGPNILAARRVLDVARDHPDLQFMLVGSVGRALPSSAVPGNVDIAGTVSSEFRRALLSIADMALNPVTTGSGTNIKMLDYFAAGIPAVSTEFGARGLGVEAGTHYSLADAEVFGDAVESVRTSDRPVLERQTAAAHAHVRDHLSWPVIGGDLLASLGRR